MVDIVREREGEEKNINKEGFRDVRNWRNDDIMMNARKTIAETLHTSLYKKRQPYCSKCALKATEKRLNDISSQLREMSEKRNNAGKVEIDMKINYDSFGGEERFKRVNDTEVMQTTNVNNIKRDIQVGIYKNFVCKTCGAIVNMQFLNEELEAEKAGKKK